MANPNQQNQNPGRQGQPDRSTGSSNQSQGSNPSLSSSGRSDSSSRSMGSQSQGGEQGDVREALRELAEGIECLCGEGSQKDVEGARRHADKAQRMIGGRASGSRSDSGSRNDSDRDSRSEGRDL